MSSNHLWRVQVRQMETRIRVGIHAHEREAAQRVWVEATVEGHYPARPQAIEDCFNYELIHRLVTQDWPLQAHKPLLEQWAVELLEAIFRADAKVEAASVSLSKPDVFADTHSVGVETRWTRAEFDKIVG